jgi:hypothetical protein
MHEPGAVHRLDRGTDRRAVTSEPLTQVIKSVGVRRYGANVDGRTLRVEQVEVETLATEIQPGVQHCLGPPFIFTRTRGASLRGRPFFMAFLRCE